jgi:hypothetical protein
MVTGLSGGVKNKSWCPIDFVLHICTILGTLENTLQRKLEDLRYKTGLLTEALQSATDLTYEDSPGSMGAVDRCIDLWNEIINLAPGTLKLVKLHLLCYPERQVQGERGSGPNAAQA